MNSEEWTKDFLRRLDNFENAVKANEAHRAFPEYFRSGEDTQATLDLARTSITAFVILSARPEEK